MKVERKPEIKDNSEEILKADLVIEALGFEPEDLPVMFNEPKLNVTRWGTLKVDYKNLMTSLDGVFAAGDIVRGASLLFGVSKMEEMLPVIFTTTSKIYKRAKGLLMNKFIQDWQKNKKILEKNHVYRELDEHSSCGVGLIASLMELQERNC